jgi:5-methylcytosine-specific restriction endonuclease McrA
VHRLANLESERERNRAYSKQWRIEHPDYGTQWRLANADKVKQNNERWQTDHPEIMGAHSRRRYARKVGAPVVEFVERLVVAERDGWICQLCGDPIDRMLAYRNPTTGRLDPGYLHIDHIIPLSKGGEHTYANTQATHARCNQRKHNKIAD